MLSKLLSLLANAKGAVIATVVVAGAATATVGATTPQVRDTFDQITSAITGQSPAPRVSTSGTSCTDEAGADASGGGQPVVVAQRNAADKLLRAAYDADHKTLQDLRGGPGQDNKVVGEIVRTYDQQLQDTLDIALNKVAALTLGRDGQVRKADASASASAGARVTGSPRPSGSRTDASESPRPSGSLRAEASESPKPSCSPKPSGSARVASASESPRPSGSARTDANESGRPSGSPKPSDQGRVAVADRTTLDSDIQQIVDQAVKDMDALVTKATDAVKNASPAPDHGRPSDSPGANNTQGNGNGNGNGNGGGGRPSSTPKKP